MSRIIPLPRVTPVEGRMKTIVLGAHNMTFIERQPVQDEDGRLCCTCSNTVEIKLSSLLSLNWFLESLQVGGGCFPV